VTPQQAREQIGLALKRAAPGSDIDTIDPDTDLRDALDLDSLDFLQFIEILSETSGHRIDEDDYPELATLNSSIRFLAARLPPGMLIIRSGRTGRGDGDRERVRPGRAARCSTLADCRFRPGRS
jgi:acyl carrier protein